MSVLNMVTGLLRNMMESAGDGDAVQQVRADAYTHWPVCSREECLRLYGPDSSAVGGGYHVVLLRQLGDGGERAFLLRRADQLQELQPLFARLATVLPPLVARWPRETLTVATLQRVCDWLRQNPGWRLAHVAAALGWIEPFQLEAVLVELVDSMAADREHFTTPLHVAVAEGHQRLVLHLLALDPAPCLAVVDSEGNTALHLAAGRANKDMVTLLAARADRATLSLRNKRQLTPLHVACMEDRPENVRHLVIAGADVNASIRMHEEAGSQVEVPSPDSTRGSVCAKSVFEAYPRQVNLKEMKRGGTPLHWARARDMMSALLELGCDIEAPNFAGETALHVMTRERLLGNVVLLLSHGARIDARDQQANTPLLLAVALGDVHLTRAFLVFGADMATRNAAGETALHRAAAVRRDADLLVHTLLAVGSPRCPPDARDCTDNCVAGGYGVGQSPDAAPVRRGRHSLDEMLSAASMSHSIAAARQRPPCRVLGLDGGGIKGLVLVQILMALEKLTGRSTVQCFDWIAGTSVGGILAIALARGKSLEHCQRLFFRLKDEVFVGSRPYSDEALEKFLKEEFGESAVMSDIVGPKVLVTGALADRHPADLHLFRNYEDAAALMHITESARFMATLQPSEQLQWRAARSSGAAPTFFRASGRFVDGGLIANNPTMDALTEIYEYQVALRTLGGVSEVSAPSAVLSLGCGRPPVVEVNAIDVFRPDSIWDYTRIGFGFQALLKLITDQATSVDNRVVDRARAWCGSLGVPFLRCSPQLSLDLMLDETSNEELLLTLWETMVYLQNKRHVLAEFAKLL